MCIVIIAAGGKRGKTAMGKMWKKRGWCDKEPSVQATYRPHSQGEGGGEGGIENETKRVEGGNVS